MIFSSFKYTKPSQTKRFGTPKTFFLRNKTKKLFALTLDSISYLKLNTQLVPIPAQVVKLVDT